MVVSSPERRHLFSFEEYTEISERGQSRVEFWEGAILDMSGGSPRHSAICSNVARILADQLDCYKLIASLRTVILVAQDRIEIAIRFARDTVA